jgi:flagellin-like protein
LVKEVYEIKMTFMKRKAVSPVIATVVLVAVAITIAVAVSYWMSGISSQYTQFEKVELTSAYCESTNVSGASYWNITLDFRNTGTTEATIIAAQINGKAIEDYDASYPIKAYNADGVELQFYDEDTYTVTPGSKGSILVTIDKDGSGYDFTSGTTIEISIRSGAGNTYMKMVTLS